MRTELGPSLHSGSLGLAEEEGEEAITQGEGGWKRALREGRTEEGFEGGEDHLPLSQAQA